MTKKERIEELERRVAELEAQPHVHYMPYWSVIPPTYGQCSLCGSAFYAGHRCSLRTYEANAELIVRCVNNHAALFDALEKYGHHTWSAIDPSDDWPIECAATRLEAGPCDCGYEAALAAARGESGVEA